MALGSVAAREGPGGAPVRRRASSGPGSRRTRPARASGAWTRGGLLLTALALAGWALAAWALTGSARAHGPAPVALSILRLGDAGAASVQASVGLARANGDGSYAYVCPSRWDGNERALAYGSPAGAILVQSLGDVWWSADGGCTFSALVTGGYVVAGAAYGGGFALLVEDDGDRARVLEVDGSGGIADVAIALPASPDGVWAEGADLWLTGAGPPAFAARWDGDRLRLLWSGELSEEARRWVPVAAEPGAVWVEAAGAGLALGRVDADGPGGWRTFERSRHGPVVEGGRRIALFDGVLHEWTGSESGGWTSLGERPWTCLQRLGGRAFACSLEGTLEIDGDDATPFFSLRQLGPPAACGDDDARMECEREWAHYGGESGWLETAPALDPVSARRPFVCRVHPGRGSIVEWSVVGLVGLAIARRRRARAC